MTTIIYTQGMLGLGDKLQSAVGVGRCRCTLPGVANCRGDSATGVAGRSPVVGGHNLIRFIIPTVEHARDRGHDRRTFRGSSVSWARTNILFSKAELVRLTCVRRAFRCEPMELFILYVLCILGALHTESLLGSWVTTSPTLSASFWTWTCGCPGSRRLELGSLHIYIGALASGTR